MLLGLGSSGEVGGVEEGLEFEPPVVCFLFLIGKQIIDKKKHLEKKGA